MKFTFSWLKEYLQTDKPLQEILAKLTAIGLEVEAVDTRAAYNAFLIAKIVTAKKHPNADKLQILQVDIGAGKPLQIVCGAPNARAGLVGVFAPPGAYIPGLDTVLSVGKIRDVESFGMMCSERELLLSDEHGGIIDLGEDILQSGAARIGQSFAAFRGLDDPIIEIGLTPNRADCASVYGIARDLAASGIGSLKPLKIAPLKLGKTVAALPVEIKDAQTCLGFSAARMEGIDNRSSPAWLQQRLRAVGINPKNALVDISNYFTFAFGRPLHMFDADKVSGSLRIRKAKKGERLAALNGKTYELNETHCVIADNSGVIALPGIIGGESTACSDKTRSVLIECAVWNPLAVARMGRDLAIISDARYRFERGVDPDFMQKGLASAVAAVREFCDTKQTKITAYIDIACNPRQKQDIVFPLHEIERLTGMCVPQQTVIEILQNLGFTVAETRKKKTEGQVLRVSPPSWRADIDGKADMVEEVLRIYGVDKIIPAPLPHHHAEGKILTPLQSATGNACRALAVRGMNEAVTYSFLSAEAAASFGGGAPSLKLANPIAANLSDMRPSLLPNLLAAVKRNSDRGFADTALFEVGDIYQSGAPTGTAGKGDAEHETKQRRMAAGVRIGTAVLAGAGRSWRSPACSVDCFDAKGDALAVLENLGMNAENVQIQRGAPGYFHPGRSGVLQLGSKNILGYFGELHPDALVLFGLDKGKQALCGFELFLDAVPQPRKKTVKSKPPLRLSPFQQITRDFSFIVADDMPVAVLVRAAAGADKKLIQSVRVFDVFSGNTVESGKKAVGIEVTILPQTQTLTDAELEALSAKLVSNVLHSTKGALR